MSSKTDYNSRADVEWEGWIGSEKADLLRKLGRMNQNGMSYPEELPDTVILSSNSKEDLDDALTNGIWDHSVRPQKVKKGWTIIVMINQNIKKNGGGFDLAIGGKALGEFYRIKPGEDENNNVRWHSDKIRDPEYHLDNAMDAEESLKEAA